MGRRATCDCGACHKCKVRVSARAYRNLKRAMRGLPPLKRRGFGQPGVQAKTNHGGNGHTLSRQRWEDFTARRREEWRKHGTNLVREE